MKPTLIRPGGLPASTSSPVVTPILPAVVYAADTPDALDAQYQDGTGYTYAREGHPNADVLARRIDAMEGAQGGLVTGSGMAAIATMLLALLRAGDHVLGGNQLYGRSLQLMTRDLPRLGVETSLGDATDIGAFEAELRPNTKLVLIEIVSNPTIRISDLDAIAALCAERGSLLAVDNTFTTPAVLRPFDHGADIVIHSLTKLLSGHSDATLGYVAARDPAIQVEIETFAVTAGFTASPFDCWLAERGLHTFDLRFQRAQATAESLAAYLGDHPNVRRVLYPTRPDHPDHARAQSLLRGQGANMLSFEIDGGRDAANALAQAAEGIAFAPTLGDVGTTLSHPASSSHRKMTPDERAAIGISEGFFRVSVGLEDPAMLIASFGAGLEAAETVLP